MHVFHHFPPFPIDNLSNGRINRPFPILSRLVNRTRFSAIPICVSIRLFVVVLQKSLYRYLCAVRFSRYAALLVAGIDRSMCLPTVRAAAALIVSDIPPGSPRIDSSISFREMSRCESILSTVPSLPVLPLIPSQNRHRHHHPSSPVSSIPPAPPLLTHHPARAIPTPPHIISHTPNPPTTAARLASPHHPQPPHPQTPNNWPTSHDTHLTIPSGSTLCPHPAP